MTRFSPVPFTSSPLGLAQRILHDVAAAYDLPPGSILSQSQERCLVPPRRAIAERLRAAGWSYSRIGRALGGRHHSSVMYWLQQRPVAPRSSEPFDPSIPDYSGEWAI